MPSQPKPKKPGRPALPKGEAKGETLRIRVTPSELKEYATKAKASKQTVSNWVRGAAMAFNSGKGYHGSEAVSGGKLSGKTGSTDYFFFQCPKCADGQVLRVLEYQFRDDAIHTKREEKKIPKMFFNLALHLYCPVCQFDDFVKIDNSHQAIKL
jgi:hypothetical protein